MPPGGLCGVPPQGSQVGVVFLAYSVRRQKLPRSSRVPGPTCRPHQEVHWVVPIRCIGSRSNTFRTPSSCWWETYRRTPMNSRSDCLWILGRWGRRNSTKKTVASTSCCSKTAVAGPCLPQSVHVGHSEVSPWFKELQKSQFLIQVKSSANLTQSVNERETSVSLSKPTITA